MSEPQAISPRCVACREILQEGAKLCPHCGTRQKRAGRYTFRILALAGGLATLLSLITAGIALAPQALSVLFPKTSARLYSAVHARVGPEDQAVLRIGLINDGRSEIFVSKLTFRTTDPLLAGLNPSSYVIRQVLPVGGVLELDIPTNDPKKSRLGTVRPSRYPEFRDKLIAANKYRPGCFFLEVNSFDEAEEPVLPQFVMAEAVTEAEAVITYSTKKTRGRAEPMVVATAEAGLTGTLMFRVVCESSEIDWDRLH
ncbi:MAG: zinc ribbon domain-containing protein [Mangrovicoccus sp.]